MGKHGHSKASKPSTATVPQTSHKSKHKHKRRLTGITTSNTTSPVSTPRIAATPASTDSLDLDLTDSLSVMEPEQSTSGAVEGGEITTVDSALALEETEKDEGLIGSEPTVNTAKKSKKKRAKTGKRSKTKKKAKEESSSDSSSSSSDSESESNDDSNISSDDEMEAQRKKEATAKKKAKTKGNEKAKEKQKNKKKKSRKVDPSRDDDSDEADSESSDDETEKKRREKRKAKSGAKGKGKGHKSKKLDSSSDNSASSSSSSDTDSEFEGEKKKQKKKQKKKRKQKPNVKAKSKMKKKQDSSSDDSSSSSAPSSSSSGESESEDGKKRKKKNRSKKAKGKKSRKAIKVTNTSSSSESEAEKETTEAAATATEDQDVAARIQKLTDELALAQLQQQQKRAGIISGTKTEETKTKKGAVEFKRVDQVWDSTIHDYKYTETGKENKDEFDCVFSVRRKFTWDNKFQYATLDIKSNLLRDVLQIILKGVRGVSLVEDKPSVHPHMVFLYYDELKAYIKKLKIQFKKAKKRKEQRKLKQQIAHCDLLAKFIDEDYEEDRKKLKSMLKAGNITYDLSWALYKPNTIAYTPTYGNKDDPRAFRVDMFYYEEDFLGNKKMIIEGRYLEYDGKIFGMGDHGVRISSFKGPKKIVNLDAYPLKYHKDPKGLEKQLIERGKKFVALQGMNYRVQNGLGYMKQKRSVARINIDGRVMVDPAIFRRINPNYQLSYIKQDEVGADSDSESCSDCDDDSDAGSESEQSSGVSTPKRLIIWKDRKGRKHLIPVPIGNSSNVPGKQLESIEKDDGIQHTFTEEELLIASPVVLGFAFSEKYWLEFSLLGIKEIEWNQEAFSSLVLQPQYKQNLKGLVSSHRFNAAKTIDDVIQGKGKGMVVVLHGPPGVGKTLTAESIAEFLRCPLYMVSAGELGTNSRSLEIDLNRIMDITHSWGAILLIDEADVFMEAREAHDIQRNSLVSVFLRLLEYYQGILFLTTNRVATFDEAFQSRIHMGIRYEELTHKARTEIWKHHIGKVVGMEGQESVPFKDENIEELARKVLNGRQIKNTVKTAQSIAISEKEKFGMGHVRRVMEVQEDFQEDMRGGRATLAHYA